MKTIDDIKLIDIMPDSIAHDKNVSASATAIDEQLRAVAKNVDIGALIVNIDKLPSAALDHLAAQYDVSVWRDSWAVQLKRSVLKSALATKRKRGTRGAVLKAVESLGSSASIVEWWEKTPKGDPHTFTIFATLSKASGGIDAEKQEDLIRQIDDAKPFRSHYELVLCQSVDGGIGVYGCVRTMTVVRVR